MDSSESILFDLFLEEIVLIESVAEDTRDYEEYEGDDGHHDVDHEFEVG